MFPPIPLRHGAQLIAIALLCAAGSVDTPAQAVNEAVLKAAFLYNFARFAEWPSESLPAGARLVLCVTNDAKVAKALEQAIAGHDVGGHALQVRRVELQDPMGSCHLLYANGLDVKAATELVQTLKSTSVLSISDFSRFAHLGGIAHLFIEDGRMRFAVNMDALQRSKLRLSSRLLSLAVIVKDDLEGSQR